MERVCVFIGSSPGARSGYAGAAQNMAGVLVERNLTLVYGGSRVGLMGILADSMLQAGGEVIGVIPEGLFSRETPHRGLTELRTVRSMHERKQVMADLSDGFVALPGGVGTLEELTEIYTWGQLGLHRKPCGLLNVEGYFDHLIDFLDHARQEGFLKQVHRDRLLLDEDPRMLLDRMEAYRTPDPGKRLDRSST